MGHVHADQLEPLHPRFVVPDHGALGDGSLIAKERAFLADLQTRSLELKRQGKSAEEASAIGPRIGVVATVSTTLDPTVRLIRRKAGERGRTVDVTERIAEGAFEALLRGDGALHDEILKQTIVALADQVDVVVLAQVSMARLIPTLGVLRVPVLSSPRSGVEAVKRALAAL